jgi:hypothetical protein
MSSAVFCSQRGRRRKLLGALDVLLRKLDCAEKKISCVNISLDFFIYVKKMSFWGIFGLFSAICFFFSLTY